MAHILNVNIDNDNEVGRSMSRIFQICSYEKTVGGNIVPQRERLSEQEQENRERVIHSCEDKKKDRCEQTNKQERERLSEQGQVEKRKRERNTIVKIEQKIDENRQTNRYTDAHLIGQKVKDRQRC